MEINIKDLTKEQIEELKAQCEMALESEKWEPKGFDYLVCGDGRVQSVTDIQGDYARNGTSRETDVQGMDLSIMIRKLARLDAWCIENGFKVEFENGNDNWYLFLCQDNGGVWQRGHTYGCNIPSTMFMTKEGAEMTCEALNSGELVL